MYMPADDIRNSDPSKANEGILGVFPYREIYLSMRAIVPLVLIMVVILKFVVRESLPSPSIEAAIFGEQHVEKKDTQNVTTEPTDPASHQAEDTKDGEPMSRDTSGSSKRGGGHGLFFFGLLCALIGMALFNIGLVTGLSPLGSQSGEIIPSAFQHVDGIPDSPRFSYGLGIAVVIVFAWVLGFLATVAEPALYVLGVTFQRLTRGQYSARTLIYAVSFGVGTGITLGVLKIIYQLPLVWFIVTGYAIALPLTIFSEEDIVSVAWDSAGVTTGPVTVPFVLTLGVSLGNAVGAMEGFGILMLASVGPIISVLMTVFLMKLLVRLGILAPPQPTEDVTPAGGEKDAERN